ncbi:MAG: glycosyltransferase [Burkholderiales bacterium]
MESNGGGKIDDAEALYQRAATEWRAGNWSQAALVAEQGIAAEPDLPALHYLLGGCRMEQQQHDAAAEAFARCMELNPDYPLSAHARAQHALCCARSELQQGAAPRVLLLSPNETRPVSVIICSIDSVRFARVTAMYERLLAGVPHEIIGIHDARSLSEGYNRGLRLARNDILVFSHDDIDIISTDFAARLLQSLAGHDVIGVAGTRKLMGEAWHLADHPHLQGQVGAPAEDSGYLVSIYGVTQPESGDLQALDGLFLAARRDIAQRLGFDEAMFDGWHFYDLDFSFRAWLEGLDCATCNHLLIVHPSRGRYDERWHQYSLRFLDKHKGRLEPALSRSPEFVSVPVSSAAEWQLMTEHLIVGDRAAR